jgi:predicted nucleic acid-binding protein
VTARASVFVDTSALYAVLDRDDDEHAPAAEAFASLLDRGSLITHSYVAVEATALLQRRLGIEAVRALVDDVLPALELVFVDESLHRAAIAALLASGERGVSLVDWCSFELMRRRGVREAFAFDDDFARQGFTLVPPA